MGLVKVIVIGAGIGGLTAALALSRTGHDVVMIERDDTPMPDDVEGAFGWDRRGAPQVRHTHGFPALIRVMLRDRFPDVLHALIAAGADEVSVMPSSVPPDAPDYERDAEDLQVLACRRTTLEWVLRRSVLAESGVEIRTGVAVAGLLVDANSDSRTVVGVRLGGGSQLGADAVVASTGRRDGVVGWLGEHGIAVAEEEHPTGTIYLSRFYRRGGEPSAPIGYLGGRRAGVGFVVAGADNGTYSATLAVDATDAELRAHLLEPHRFEAVLPLFREMEPVVRAGGTPITPVQVMGGLVNRIRRFCDADGGPLASGFFAIGDAHTCTNPVYGRGSSLAVLQAVLLADALAAHPADLTAAGRMYEETCSVRVEPWFDISVMTDAASRPHDATHAVTDEQPKAARLDLQAMRRIAGSTDPHLAVLMARMMSLLLTPQEVFGDPDVLERLAAAAASQRPRDPGAPRPPALTRADLLGAAASAQP